MLPAAEAAPRSTAAIARGIGLPSCLTSVADLESTAPAREPPIFASASAEPVRGPLALYTQHSSWSGPS